MEQYFVIVGGGIAGVSCAESLAFLEPNVKILLISESSLIKTVTNLQAVTRTLSKFDIVEKDSNSLNENYPNVNVIHDRVIEIDSKLQVVTTCKAKYKYQYLCVCTGAQPKLIPQSIDNEFVLGIRDTDSVETLLEKLSKSKTIVIVGNGGIASELVYKCKDIDVHWVIKDNHISATFIDPGTAEFFQSVLHDDSNESLPVTTKRMRYEEDLNKKSGAALGPDWYKNFNIRGGNIGVAESVHIHYQCEVESITKTDGHFPITVTLTNNTTIPCDLVISATGVKPNISFKVTTNFELSQDGDIKVNEFMETSIPGIYAAGDVCTANWPHAKHWFQMKLWTQARQMGCYAAKCISGAYNKEPVLQDFCFELFAHSTNLFGYKVILLGLYNGQKLGKNYEILLRMTKKKEYIKFVLENDKLQGVVLIGETDLEETCENLILNQLDLSPYGDDILNPDIDIEDYFD